jgi:hypothetical protein
MEWIQNDGTTTRTITLPKGSRLLDADWFL